MNAELLLMSTLGRDRAYLYAHPERELAPNESARYEAALAERARGVPAQYITGHQEFWGMDLIVTPAVLIPRPETEHVVEAALELLAPDLRPQTIDLKNQRPRAEGRGLRSDLRIVDVGTGSGCIALALAREFATAEIHATDVSAAALEVARANAARHQLENRIQFHDADLLQGLGGGFDFVVSNPPYVGESEADQVQLEVISQLIPQAYAALRPGGWLVFEVSGTIADAVRSLLDRWDGVDITPDLQSIPRVARARKPA